MKLDTLLRKSWRGAVAVLGVTMILGLIQMPGSGQVPPPIDPDDCKPSVQSDTGCKDFQYMCSLLGWNWQIIVECHRWCCYRDGYLYATIWEVPSACDCTQNRTECCSIFFPRNCMETAQHMQSTKPCPQVER
ncbi:MAG: hypothetical protein AMXMBFR61_02770 [Fimbriimonadales bacterium]